MISRVKLNISIGKAGGRYVLGGDQVLATPFVGRLLPLAKGCRQVHCYNILQFDLLIRCSTPISILVFVP